jgi:hypothetical protein
MVREGKGGRQRFIPIGERAAAWVENGGRIEPGHRKRRRLVRDGMATTEELLQAIAKKVARRQFRLSLHAEKERRRDRILHRELVEALGAPELLEDYPDDSRGHSCLVLGFSAAGDPIHGVAGELLTEEVLVIITVYRPDPDGWTDWWKRR